MQQKTKAIVISSLKYADTSLIVSCYTEEYGIKTYLLKGILTSKKGKIKKALFQPLTQLEIIANHNNKGHLNSIKDAQIFYHYKTLHSSIIKQSINLFLSEILASCLREEETNKTLYHFLETAFIWLDTNDKSANFHLLFLVKLTKYLGFYPEVKNNMPYFDLVEGSFTLRPTSNIYIQEPLINHFKTLLGIKFDALPDVHFNKKQRQELVEFLIQYISLHLHAFKTPKSLMILHELFN